MHELKGRCVLARVYVGASRCREQERSDFGCCSLRHMQDVEDIKERTPSSIKQYLLYESGQLVVEMSSWMMSQIPRVGWLNRSAGSMFIQIAVWYVTDMVLQSKPGDAIVPVLEGDRGSCPVLVIVETRRRGFLVSETGNESRGSAWTLSVHPSMVMAYYIPFALYLSLLDPLSPRVSLLSHRDGRL